MKLARFLAKGRVHQGVYREGLLLDEAGEAHRPEDVTWLLPFTPGKILGVALNYQGHAEELGLSRPEEPALFWKPQPRPQGVGRQKAGKELQEDHGGGKAQGEEEPLPEALLGQTPHILQAEADLGKDLPRVDRLLGHEGGVGHPEEGEEDGKEHRKRQGVPEEAAHPPTIPA